MNAEEVTATGLKPIVQASSPKHQADNATLGKTISWKRKKKAMVYNKKNDEARTTMIAYGRGAGMSQ